MLYTIRYHVRAANGIEYPRRVEVAGVHWAYRELERLAAHPDVRRLTMTTRGRQVWPPPNA